MTQTRAALRPTVLTALLAALLSVLLAPAPASAASLQEVTGFGSNPGALKMYRYVPDGLPAGRPVVVALHGCTQNAAGYASGTGWTTLADRWGFSVVLPQQQSGNNLSQCFNWFESADIKRGQGEAASVAQMVEADIRFHQFLYELSGNPLIAETAALHWLHIRRVMGGYLQRDRARDDIWDEHAAILGAVADGAAERAERLAREHAETSARKLTGALAAEHAPQHDLREDAQKGRNAR